MRIDSHQHYWTLRRTDYGWLTPDLAPLYRDFQPADLAPERERHGVCATVAVQAAPTVAETEYLLGLADADTSLHGVVGWVDLLAADVAPTLARLARHTAFKGVRPMLQDLADDDWIADPRLARAGQALVRERLSFDALVRVRHLPHLVGFACRHPDLPIVIDHAAKPDFEPGHFEPWRRAMQPLAALPNVCCKLSGLLTEFGPGGSAADLRSHVDVLLELFGPARLMWGSDWPVLHLAAGYGEWVRCTDALLAPLAAAERGEILFDTCNRFYRLGLRRADTSPMPAGIGHER